MGSGWFEILFILLILLAPVFEAWKKQRGRGDAGAPDEREREGAGPAGGRDASAGRAEHHGRSASGRDGPAGAGEARRRGEEDRGAEELLPDDLWKILTGEAPPGAPSPSPRPRPKGPEPTPASREQEPASFGTGGEGGREREPVSAEAAPPVEPGRAPGTDLDAYRSAGLEPADSEPGGADLGGLMSERPERAGRTELRTEARPGEIGSGTYRVGAEEREGEREQPRERMQRTITEAATQRGDAAPTHRFFRELDRDELRRAIVLNEVLGPPLALRDGRER